MPGAVKTECPHCGASLKLASENAIGRRARCPKCREAFVVEADPPPEADPDVDDFEKTLEALAKAGQRQGKKPRSEDHSVRLPKLNRKMVQKKKAEPTTLSPDQRVHRDVKTGPSVQTYAGCIAFGFLVGAVLAILWGIGMYLFESTILDRKLIYTGLEVEYFSEGPDASALRGYGQRLLSLFALVVGAGVGLGAQMAPGSRRSIKLGLFAAGCAVVLILCTKVIVAGTLAMKYRVGVETPDVESDAFMVNVMCRDIVQMELMQLEAVRAVIDKGIIERALRGDFDERVRKQGELMWKSLDRDQQRGVRDFTKKRYEELLAKERAGRQEIFASTFTMLDLVVCLLTAAGAFYIGKGSLSPPPIQAGSRVAK